MLIKKSIKLLLVSVILAITIASLAYGDDPAKELRERGFKAATEGRYDEAIKLYRKIIASYPNSEYADDAQWGIIFILDDPNERYTECQNLLTNYPNSRWAEEALRVMANITFSHKKDYHEAINLSRKFLKIYSKSQHTLKTFKEMLEKYPNSPESFQALQSLAAAYQRQNKWEDAQQLYKTFLKEHPDHKDAQKIKKYLKLTEERVRSNTN